MDYSLNQFVELEENIWRALKTGDSALDAKFLSDDFLGVYPSGFSDKAKHCAQLENGPIVTSYQILEPKIIVVGEGLVMFCYLARYTPAENNSRQEEMYISSLWKNENRSWLNIFSQDSPKS